jgi:hypothetical protein
VKTELDLLLAAQRLYDDLPRWRWELRWQTRRHRERVLRRLVADPPREAPRGEAPLLRGL